MRRMLVGMQSSGIDEIVGLGRCEDVDSSNGWENERSASVSLLIFVDLPNNVLWHSMQCCNSDYLPS